MTAPNFQTLPGETVLREKDQVVHFANSPLGFGYNTIFGHLTLTNQRIVFKRLFSGKVTAYPLKHITGASVVQKNAAVRDFRYAFQYSHQVLLVEFDNGGREYFLIKDEPETWAQAILSARGDAPSLPYVQIPPTKSGMDGNAFLWIAGGMLAVFACVFGSFIGLFACVFLTMQMGR